MSCIHTSYFTYTPHFIHPRDLLRQLETEEEAQWDEQHYRPPRSGWPIVVIEHDPWWFVSRGGGDVVQSQNWRVRNVRATMPI